MDFLQIGLIFLIGLLTVFLTVSGVQVFFILRDLRKALDKFNQYLGGGEVAQAKPMKIAATIEKPKTSKPKFYKKVLK